MMLSLVLVYEDPFAGDISVAAHGAENA